jgi:hypothetical protein
MMYITPLLFLALIVWAFYSNKDAEDEKMKAKGFVRLSDDNKPDLGVQVKLQAKSGVIPKSKYPQAETRGSGVSVTPQTYVLFEVDGELIWVPPVSHYQILAFKQGKYYKPNTSPNYAFKHTYIKGDKKYRTEVKS